MLQDFYYLDLNANNYPAFRKNCIPQPTDMEHVPLGTDYQYLYRQTGTGNPGYLVDGYGIKYAQAKTWQSVSNPFSYYVVMNKVGCDAKPRHLQDYCDYQLRDGESLLINYTQAITDQDGNQTGSVVHDEPYGAGAIIRPSGFGQNGLIMTDDQTGTKKIINGVQYSVLGTKEQIEIRKPVEVVFGETENDTDVYWVRNNEAALIAEAKAAVPSRDYIDLFDGGEVIDADTGKVTYTLQDNEYFFYTNKAHTDFGYVGAGTVIEKTGNINLHKAINKQSISLDEIVEKGIDAAIDWLPCASWHPINSILTLKEYQYYTLTEKDQITGIIGTDYVCPDTQKPYMWRGNITQASIDRYSSNGQHKPDKITPIEADQG